MKEKEIEGVPTTPFAYLWNISKPFKGWAFLAIFFVVVAASADAAMVLFVKWFLIFAEEGNMEKMLILGTLFPVAYFIVSFIWRVSGLFGQKWFLGINKATFNDLSRFALAHSHSYFSNNFAGSLSSKVGRVARSMEGLAVHILWQYMERSIFIIATGVVVFLSSVLVGWVYVALVVTLVIINILLLPRKRKRSFLLAQSQTKHSGLLVDVFSNVAAVRQYAQLGTEADTIEEGAETVRQRARTSFMYTEYMLFINGLILFVFSTAMFWFLSQQLLSGAVQTADFATVMVLWFQVSGTLIFLGGVFEKTAQMYAEAEEGLAELVVPHEITDSKDATELDAEAGEVAWDNVTFTFGENAVFQDFSLTIPSGQTVGLVGHSGAGKTTFVSLLLRQHDVDGGAIKIDGQDISTVTQDSLRAAIAVVPQEPALFHRSIRENIAYGKPDATDEEIIAVAKKAQAHDFIATLPEGYDTMVGERGVKLSGGQKQRVAIARAMLKNAPILVLDEATSALDSESEVAIQKALKELMEDKTVIAVAHRLSTLREMDRIIVLEAGKVVEDGTHAELVQKTNGIYKSLWEHQAGGFVGE